MSGQSVMDRVIAAKHSIAGAGLAKSVCKATTEEIIGPKKKHLDYLVHCTNEPNVSIPQMADLLIERAQHANWVVVFKALISIHNLMNYGNERFSQYFASNNCSFNLGAFMDKSGVHGYDMSTFVRRYSKYLNAKSLSYRTMAYDFCKVKRGKDDGLLRTMSAEKLLKTVPPLQTQLDALIEFDCTPNELTNGVMNACFMLLFKDLIRLFACYNDGIINLLEKFFDMNKKQCKDALEIYKRFLVRMEKVSEFLKVAENVGIDKGDIPDLAKAPSSLLQALEDHYEFLENKKGTAPAKPAGFTTALSTMASNIPVTDEEKTKILLEENKQFEEFKKQKDYTSPEQGEAATNPFLRSPTQPAADSTDLFGAPVMKQNLTNGTTGKSSDDLLSLNTNPFQQNIENVMAQTNSSQYPGYGANIWGGSTTDGVSSSFATDNSFAAAFGSDQMNGTHSGMHSGTHSGTHSVVSQPPPGFDSFGDVLRPQMKVTPEKKESKKLIDSDLDTSMMQLAGSLNIKGSDQIKKTEHQWQPKSDQRLTGGTNWQQPLTSGSTWSTQTQYTQQPQMMGAPRMQYAAGMQGMVGTTPYMGMSPNMGMMPNAMVPGQVPMPGYNQPMMGGYPQQPRMPQQTQVNDPFGSL